MALLKLPTALLSLCTATISALSLTLPIVPSVLLKNAANPNTLMPVVGQGTGGYTGNASQPYGTYPECFNGCEDAQCIIPDSPGFSGCAEYVQAAVTTWLQLGGRRVDNSASYHNQRPVGIAIAASGVNRSDIFYVSKVGPYLPLGFNDSLAQFAGVLATTGMKYVDLLYIHWPSCASGGGCTDKPNSTEPACQFGGGAFNERLCRLATLRALVQVCQHSSSMFGNEGGGRALIVPSLSYS